MPSSKFINFAIGIATIGHFLTLVCGQDGNSTLVQKAYVSTGSGACTGSADCGNGQGTCSSFGKCICYLQFTCPDCSQTCTGTWPSMCTATCPPTISIGGATCTSCMDCFNCDGGTCTNGKCKCFGGWTCPHCEVNTETTTTRECTFNPSSPNTPGGGSTTSKSKKSSALNAGQIFGIAFGGGIALCLFMMCLRSTTTDRQSEIAIKRAKEARAAATQKSEPKLTGIELMEARRLQKQQQQQPGGMATMYPSHVAPTMGGSMMMAPPVVAPQMMAPPSVYSNPVQSYYSYPVQQNMQQQNPYY